MSKGCSTKLTSRGGRWVFMDKASDAKSDQQTASTKDSESPERHPEFFFDNTLIAIQIGKTLFNVHKYQLAKSEVFSDMFKLPKPEGDEPEEGLSPEHPIKLEGVSGSDFAALLRVLYASQFSCNQPRPEASLVIPAFRLANMFNFLELREYLLPLAEENLGDVDKIVFSREFDIKEWLAPAHIRLCKREEPLTEKEAQKLGVESVLIISRMREKHRTRPAFIVNSHYCSSCAGMTRDEDSDHECDECGGDDAMFLYEGPGRVAQSGTTVTDEASVEAGIKKWVEDGCTLKE
ncbi:unnamed protein product [Rhizoctonia solani]|uniref:BTB domain-containing protein n=1 Tax=Rhizoctonia solani TaxID=456999 RepID=A0A8H3DW39_9AGAM|nr:unnamed protein product [Rhizoctonia solani]